MTSRFQDIIVIAQSEKDFRAWAAENDELMHVAVGIVAADWSGVAPSRLGFAATTYIMTEQSALAAGIGGSEPPRWFRVADAIAEHRRPAYLKVAA